MQKNKWLNYAIATIIVMLLLLAGGMLATNWSYHGWGMMGPGRMMMDWGYSPSGWARLIITWLIPTGFIMLALLGTFWLIYSTEKRKSIRS